MLHVYPHTRTYAVYIAMNVTITEKRCYIHQVSTVMLFVVFNACWLGNYLRAVPYQISVIHLSRVSVPIMGGVLNKNKHITTGTPFLQDTGLYLIIKATKHKLIINTLLLRMLLSSYITSKTRKYVCVGCSVYIAMIIYYTGVCLV